MSLNNKSLNNSFQAYMKNGKDDVVKKKCAPKDKRIKNLKAIELPKIDQDPKESVDLLSLLKNMKWKNNKPNRTELPSTDESENSEPPIVKRQIISHELTGVKNHSACVKAQPFRNHVSNRKIPEAKPSVIKPKNNAPKAQINRPAPPHQSPSQKFPKPQNNAVMTKAKPEFAKRNPKNLSSLNISAKNANAKINRPNATQMQPQNQELMDTQNEIAKVQAELEFLRSNPDYIPEMDVSDEKSKMSELKPEFQSENQELIDTQNEVAKVQAALEFLKNNPDYIPEPDDNENKPKNNEPKTQKLQPQSRELIGIHTEIAKVAAELEFLKNNSDYIPETNKCIPKAQKLKNNEPKVFKSNVNLNKSKEYLKKTVTKTSPTKQSNIPKLNSKSETALADEYEEFADNPKALEDIQRLREAETKVAATKSKLALMKNYTKILQQKEYEEEADTQKVAEAKNNVAKMKSQLEILEENQEESFEDYRKRMQKCNRRRKPNTTLDTITEEDSEVFEDSCEEQEDITEAEDIIEVEVNQVKFKVTDEEECETLDEEGCEEAGGEECEEADLEECEEAKEECKDINKEEREESDEECEETDEECQEADEETQDINDEEREESKHENNNSEKFDTKIPAQQKRQLLDILKKISWGKTEESSDNKEESVTECVETQLAVEVVESSEVLSDSLKERDLKFDNLEIQPLDTKTTESILPKACKEEIFTSFLKSTSLQEERLKSTLVINLESVSRKSSQEDIFTSFFKNKSSHEEEMVSASEKSLLEFRTLQEELLESSSVDTPKTEEVYTKSISENEPEMSHSSEDGSFSSFFEDKPLIKPKHKIQVEPTESVSDQSESLSETKRGSKTAVLVETTAKDLQQQPDTIGSNLKQGNEDEIVSKGLKQQSSLIKCKLEQDNRDETTSEDLKNRSSSIKCNMETTIELSTHKVINVAPCEMASKIVVRPMELEYSEDFESDSSDKPTKPNPQYTEVRDFTSDSEKEESLKIESVHMSEDSSKGSKQSFICHLYKVKIRIKTIRWRGSGNMEAVNLSFYNPFTKENAAVKRKFVLPYFYTEDFYCYVSYISPPNMLDSSLAYYPPVILISKRKSFAELARGVINLNKKQTNVPLTKNGKIMGDIMLSAKILDYGPLRDKDDSSNEIIEIVFKETKNKEIKLVSPLDFVDKTLQKKKKHLIVEDFSSSGDNTSSDLPPDQLFKKRPFRYKRKTKNKRTERSKSITSEESLLDTSSISIQTSKIKKRKSFINNCKDVQTDVQEKDLDRRKSKSKMIQTESDEMDSQYTTTRLQRESKLTQTEATNVQQTVRTPKNEQPKKYKMAETTKEFLPAENEEYRVRSPLNQQLKQQIISIGENKLPEKYGMVMTNEKLTQSSITDESEENWKTESVTVEKPKKVKIVSPEPLKQQKLKQVRAEEIFPKSEVIKLKQNKSRSKKSKWKTAPKQLDFRNGHQKSTNHKTEAFDLAEECTDEETPEAVHRYMQGKKLAERFFKVCTERKPPLFDKMTYEEQKLYKCNYVKQLRDGLPSDFVTPPSIKTKEKDSSERRWMSHMAAFLNKNKGMLSDGSSSSVDKTDDQVPEIHSEVAAPDVLINNPDYHAMKKYYHPELGKSDVMTSTSHPYVRPATTECGMQTSDRVIKNFTAQTEQQEQLLPLLSKKSKKLANKTSELQTCLVIVDTIPSARNGGKKIINKNILYEKVRESEKLQDKKTKVVKKSSKTARLSKSNIQLESYSGQCVGAMPNKNLVTNFQFELQDFVKNIKLELHILKHRAQYAPDSNVQHRKKNSRESTDFDRLVNSFTSLVAQNEERDFNAVYSELQQLKNLVYNRFKKFSEEDLEKTEFCSKTKQIKDVANYVSQDKKLKLIFKDPKMDQALERRSHDDNNYYRQKPSRG